MQDLILRIAEWDREIILWIQENLRRDVLTDFFYTFTRLGNYGRLWIGIILLVFLFGAYRNSAIIAVFSLASTFLVVDFIIKPIVSRTRPYMALEHLSRLVPVEKSFSFPSGHAATAFAVAYVMVRKIPFRYGISCITLAILMAFSRVYVGVHYPSDVIFGAIVGIIIGEISIQVGNRFLKEKA